MDKHSYLKNEMNKIGIELDEDKINKLLSYYKLLIEWNSFMNLTGITEFEDVVIKHYIDSLSLIKAVDLKKNISLIDIGTGAGFPGLPLKIVFPNLKVTLLDSLQKRIKFLDQVIDELDLKNIEAIHGRAEDLARSTFDSGSYREYYDLCVSRAVANLSTLSEYCIPFVKLNGYFISYKSEKLSQEIDSANNAISVLGGTVEKQVDFTIGEEKIYRNLVLIKKINNTPKQYPRKCGTVSKKPII